MGKGISNQWRDTSGSANYAIMDYLLSGKKGDNSILWENMSATTRLRELFGSDAEQIINAIKYNPNSIVKKEQASEFWGKLLDYMYVSGKQVLLGRYTDDTNTLGTIAQIGLSLTGFDALADVRDLIHDLTHWEWTWEHAEKTLMDGIGLVPVAGVVKNTDEISGLIKGASKHSDEIADGFKSVKKSGGDVLQGAGRKTGEFIDNTADTITKGEKHVVDDLVSQGKTVERIPKDPKAIDKSPDFKVDGVKTELKTLENANTNTGMKRIQEGFNQYAETVIIDARNSGLTNSQANEIINRAIGKYPNGQLPGKVEIWIRGQVITYP